jgi:ParB-like chromosome segregation protein Spo0J
MNRTRISMPQPAKNRSTTTSASSPAAAIIIAGHGRYEAAVLLGLQEVPVIRVEGLSAAKRRALALADNKIAQNAGWDRELLATELPELADILVVEGP